MAPPAKRGALSQASPIPSRRRDVPARPNSVVECAPVIVSEERRSDPGTPGVDGARVLAVEPDLPRICGIRCDAVVVAPAISAAAVEARVVRRACLQHGAGLQRAEGISGAAS